MYLTNMTDQPAIATTVSIVPGEDESPYQESVEQPSSGSRVTLPNGNQQGDRGIRALVKAIYKRIPWHLRWVLGPLVYCYSAFNEVRPRFWIAEGQEDSDGMRAAVLCAAPGRSRSYLLHQFLGSAYRERCIGRRWLWDIPKVVAGEGRGCCMVAIRTLGRFRRLLKPGRWLYVPGWVTGDVDLPLSPGVLGTETVKSDLRRIRKNALRFQVTQDIAGFDDFYDHMYVPYITQAHGDRAVVVPYESMKADFKECELLLVMQGENPIAGMLISHAHATPRLWSLGIRDANREFVRDGAIGALYHFSLRHLHENGFRQANLGLSRPFLLDGVLRYKKKLGMRLSRAGREWFAIRVLEDSKAARGLLRGTPLIFERDGLLYGAVFPETSASQMSEEDFERFDKDFFMEGLAQVLIVPLGDSSARAMIPSRLSGRIAVCRSSDVL
jgi:hypothetical protein